MQQLCKALLAYNTGFSETLHGAEVFQSQNKSATKFPEEPKFR